MAPKNNSFDGNLKNSRRIWDCGTCGWFLGSCSGWQPIELGLSQSQVTMQLHRVKRGSEVLSVGLTYIVSRSKDCGGGLPPLAKYYMSSCYIQPSVAYIPYDY
jgi:hypothetical protein